MSIIAVDGTSLVSFFLIRCASAAVFSGGHLSHRLGPRIDTIPAVWKDSGETNLIGQEEGV